MTLGRLSHAPSVYGGPDAWVLDAAPDVHLRAKRVFGKIALADGGVLRLSDSPETCCDLAWFLQRYPLEMSDADRARLKAAAAGHHELLLSLETILGGDYQPPAFELAKPPRSYQAREADLLLRTGRLLVGDDVGLGKTVTGICAFTDGRALPAVVVCPTHLQRQWDEKIREFAPALRPHILRSGRPYAWPKFFGQGPDVIITSYHKLSGWAKVLSSYAKAIVFDEVQELRHQGTAKYTAAHAIASAMRFRLGLSATPIYNLGGEIFSVLDLLAPGCLGTRAEFVREWCGGHVDAKGRSRLRDPKAFGLWARRNGLLIRHTRAEVGRELPDVIRIQQTVACDESALSKVENAASALARLILDENPAARQEHWKASEELNALLRQATGIAKAPFVADFVRMLVESGERVVLCGWHHAVYKIWQWKLGDLGVKLYTGTESAPEKAAAKQAFLDGTANVLILSLRSGAGLDGLQVASSCIVFGELDWSPGVHEQCIGRLHRDGQDSPVVAYFLTAEEGADPAIIDVLGLKRQQVEGIRNPTTDFLERLDTGGGHAKALAQRYLAQIGQPAEVPA